MYGSLPTPTTTIVSPIRLSAPHVPAFACASEHSATPLNQRPYALSLYITSADSERMYDDLYGVPTHQVGPSGRCAYPHRTQHRDASAEQPPEPPQHSHDQR
jgi:hypothetical protein